MVFDTEAGGGTRMATDTVTVDSALAALDTDARLATPRDRCAVLHDLAQWSRGFTKDAYAARQECAAYPYDKHPWES